jgi:general secretion pathway protein I
LTVHARQRGFTLIEVVVAFVVLCLVLSVGFEIFSTGMQRAGDLDERSRALTVAQSRLADAGMEANFAEGQSSGDSDDRRFHWTTTVTPTEEGQVPNMPALTTYLLYRVEVRVDWTSGSGRPRQLTLATLALGSRPQ